MKTIDFWFDYISHNAYLAWHGLKQTAAEFDLEIRPQPVVFAGLLNHYGGKGPAELPAKSHWMLKNVLRKAHHMGLPIQPPASHPFNPLLTLRATLAINDMEQRRQFVERMFQAIWAQSHDASSTDTITLCAADIGLDGAALLSAANDPDIKDILHQQTRDAIRQNIFGVPSMIVNEQLFWGYDDLAFLEQHLRQQDNGIDAPTMQAWNKVRPSAKR